MRYNELHKITQKPEPKPDTYEAGMALNQLLKIGTHAIKIHNMIDDRAEMEAWVAKKIDLASNYVKSVHGYTAGSKAGTYNDSGMTEDAGEEQASQKLAQHFQKRANEYKASGDTSDEYEEMQDIADAFRTKGIQAGIDEINSSYFEFSSDPFGRQEQELEPADKDVVDLLKQAGYTYKIVKDPNVSHHTFKRKVVLQKIGKEVSEDEDKKTVIHSITPGSEKEKGMMQAAIFQGGKRTNVLAATPKDLANQYIKNGVNYNDFNFLHTSDVDFPEEDDGWNNEKYGNDAHGFIQDALKILKNYKGESLEARLEAKLREDAGEKIANMAQNMSKDEFMSHADELGLSPEEAAEHYDKMSGGAHAGKFEDAGEGHMSKSQLYQTAKMAIELLDMINKGDDLEGWVQTKLNLAADYLQAVYHYEDYQKLNPYREDLDSSLMQRHAGIIQKHLDEILSKDTKTKDVDTKPGMMRILKKRVNEVEKEIAKENRSNEEAPPGREKQVKKLKGKFKDKGAPYAIAWAQHNKHGKPKNEAELEEGKIKDWAKSLAMAGIFVAGLAGVGSINDAINNSVPAIKAMNNALEVAKDQNNNELVAQIEKDIKGAKLRLDIGKDLNQVKYLQDKYSEFMPTEGLAYESKLAIMLNQQLK